LKSGVFGETKKKNPISTGIPAHSFETRTFLRIINLLVQVANDLLFIHFWNLFFFFF
jgi:hypothetical protein